MTSAALVAAGPAHCAEGAPREEERTLRARTGRGAVTGREARPPVAGDRGSASSSRRAKRASLDAATSSRIAPVASLGLAGASRIAPSTSQRTTSASQRTRSASHASIDPASLVAVAHLLAPSGTHWRPTAPLRVTQASPFTPRSLLQLERQALASASASRGAESACRNTLTDAHALPGAALARSISAHDGALAFFGRRNEALAASEGALIEEREASWTSTCVLQAPREALLTPRAALPVSREALVTPRAAVGRRTCAPAARSVPRHAMECAGGSGGGHLRSGRAGAGVLNLCRLCSCSALLRRQPAFDGSSRTPQRTSASATWTASSRAVSRLGPALAGRAPRRSRPLARTRGRGAPPRCRSSGTSSSAGRRSA